jgi:hypothetical protein
VTAGLTLLVFALIRSTDYGVAVLSTVAVCHTHHYLHTHAAGASTLPRALVTGFDAAFLAGAALAAAGLLVTALVLRPRQPTGVAPEPVRQPEPELDIAR